MALLRILFTVGATLEKLALTLYCYYFGSNLANKYGDEVSVCIVGCNL